MISLNRILATAILAIAGTNAASAAPTLLVTNGKLMGANGVLVNQVSYDVQFKEGSYNSLFPNGLTSRSWATFAWGGAAAQALSDQVFTGNYDTTPSLTNGCTTNYCDVFTVSINATVANAFDVNYFNNLSGTSVDQFRTLINWDKTADLSSYPGTTYAVWSLSTSVPEPASTLLIGLGLAALAGRRRKA